MDDQHVRHDRRRLLQLAGALPVVPVGFGVGDPSLPQAPAVGTEPLFVARLQLGPGVDLGSEAGRRVLFTVLGGRFEGPRLRGTVVGGSATWQRGSGDAPVVVEARYTLLTDDGHLLPVIDRGVRGTRGEGAQLRTAPEFQPAAPAHAWLAQSVFVGLADFSRVAVGGELRLGVHRVL